MSKESKKDKIATALKYKATEERAPRVIAKGKGIVAEKILEKAEEHHVSVYKDEMLSKQLYNLSIGEEIPPELYHVIAEVLVFIAKSDEGARKR